AVRVLHFQTNIWKPPTTRVFARYNFTLPSAKTVYSFSICYRMLLHTVAEGNVHFSYENSHYYQNSLLINSIYPGSSGVIVYSQHISVKFPCNFEIYRYPFDFHRCFLTLTSEALNDSVHFAALRSQQQPRDSFSFFSIQKISQQVFSEDGISVLQTVVYLERLPAVPLVQVMLPSCQLTVVAYTTLFIRSSFLHVRLPLTLSTLLMLVTLFRQAMETLPRTPYVKVLDAWFLSV
ncbi:Neurotransmitter-gated ion-channel ligand-binding domain, partial [Trinorchestia longiramus]